MVHRIALDMYFTHRSFYHHLLIWICLAILQEICEARRGGGGSRRSTRTRYGTSSGSSGSSGSSSGLSQGAKIAIGVVVTIILLFVIMYTCYRCAAQDSRKDSTEEQDEASANQEKSNPDATYTATDHPLSPGTQPDDGGPSRSPAGPDHPKDPPYPLEMAPPTYNQVVNASGNTYLSTDTTYEKHGMYNATQI